MMIEFDESEESESLDYSSLTEIYTANVTNPRFLTLLFSSCLIFFCLQKIGELLHSTIVKEHRQKKTSAPLLGTYFQSILHVLIVSISSYLMIFKFNSRINELENMTISHPQFIYIDLYRISTVVSIAYFIMLTPYELFGLEQKKRFRIIMSIHHIICIMGQSLIFLTNPLCSYVSAIGLQCEFSTLFLNIRAFGLAMDNKYLYFIGGIGTFIFYPLTRCFAFLFVISTTYDLRYRIMEHIGLNGYLLAITGQIFVFIMSIGYSFVLLKDPEKLMVLKGIPGHTPKGTKQG